jgi:prevent-host-death family protein
MIRLSASKVRDEFADALNKVAFQGQRIILRRHGKDVAALVPLDDLKLIRKAEDERDVAAAKKALKEKGSIPLQTVKKKLGL